MLNYLKLNEKCLVNKVVPIETLNKNSPEEKELFSAVININWLASLRPQELGIPSYNEDKRIYEEIQIFEVTLSNIENMYIISSAFMKMVNYPLIVILKYKDKYKLCLSKPYLKIQNNENLVKGFFHTYWIHLQSPSPITQRLIAALDINQYTGKNIYEFYCNYYNKIILFESISLSKSRVYEFIDYYCGICTDEEKENLLAYCDAYKIISRDYTNPKTKYGKRNIESKMFMYQYDLEDLWYSFSQNEKINTVFKNRGLISMNKALARMYRHLGVEYDIDYEHLYGSIS